MANECPKKPMEMRRNNYNNNEYGRNHEMERDESKIHCYYCKAPGHLVRTCPVLLAKNNNQSQNQTQRYYNNNSNNNQDYENRNGDNDITMNRSSNNSGTASQGRKPIICFKCRQPGHFSAACPNN